MPLSASQDQDGLNSQGTDAFRKVLRTLSQTNAGTNHGPWHDESNIKALTEIKNNKRNIEALTEIENNKRNKVLFCISRHPRAA